LKVTEETIAEYYAGRPSLSTPRQASPELKARVPVELRERVQQEARRRGISQSELLREALEQFLAS
jgi:predicted HicB family RNase H-like nuclease